MSSYLANTELLLICQYVNSPHAIGTGNMYFVKYITELQPRLNPWWYGIYIDQLLTTWSQFQNPFDVMSEQKASQKQSNHHIEAFKSDWIIQNIVPTSSWGLFY